MCLSMRIEDSISSCSFLLAQGSQLPAGLVFAGKYQIQQDRQRTGSSATVLAHDISHQEAADEDPAEV